MRIKTIIMISLYLMCIPSRSFSHSIRFDGKKDSIYRGRAYFLSEGKLKKSCINCHNLSGQQKYDYPLIVGREANMENIDDHIEKNIGSLREDEKRSIVAYIQKLSTKYPENRDGPSQIKNNQTIDVATREKLMALGYVGDSQNSYTEPIIRLDKTVDFSSVELLKYSSYGFEIVRDSLSDIGLGLSIREQYLSAIGLPVLDLQGKDFNLKISYNNASPDSKAVIKVYDYYHGDVIKKFDVDISESKTNIEQSIVLQKQYQKVIVYIRFDADDSLKIYSLSLEK